MNKNRCYIEDVFQGGKKLRRCPKPGSPKEHYGHMESDEHPEISEPSGLFNFPEDLKGKTNWGERKFVVFYFDYPEDYDRVVAALSEKTTKEHPHMDTNKLLGLLDEK